MRFYDREYDKVTRTFNQGATSGFWDVGQVGGTILHLTEEYFRRNIMRAVAKPGWFDE